MYSYSGKVVVITGASRGIGRELALEFAKFGATVVINYYACDASANNVRQKIVEQGGKSLVVKADITRLDDVNFLYKSVKDELGRIDVLINNAGICDDNLINFMSYEKWQRILDVNLTGTFLVAKAFSKMMIKQKSGKILNISSIKGQEGSAGQVNYSASKAGIIGFTKALAKELQSFS